MTKIIKKPILAGIISLLIMFSTSSEYAFAETLRLGLGEAIEVALENNETYQISRQELEKANAQVTEAVAGALPQITGGLTFIKNWRVPTGVFQMNGETVTFKFGTDNTYTADLTLTQPIYAGGRTFTALKIAKTYKKMAKEIAVSAKEDLKISVYNGFFGALLADEVYRVRKESYDLASQNLEVVQKMFDQGMAAEYDLLRARVGVAILEPDVIRAQNEKEVALISLKTVLGVDLNTSLELKADYDSSQFIIAPLSREQAVDELKSNRPEIVISEYNSKLRQNMVSLAKAGYRPSLMFSSSLQYQSQFNNGNVFDKKWDRSLNSVVSLSVPIFDSWRTPSKVKQARIDVVQSKLQQESVEKYMILDYEQSLGRYTEARKRLAAQGGAVELAHRGLDIANVRYENGVGTQLEVSDARLALTMAEINKAVAFHDLAVSYASLLRSLGREIKAVF